MEKRKLGKSDIEVAPLAFGGNVFGWTADKATSFQLLDAFADYGFNLIDTADVYSTWVPGNEGGESESIIGKWLSEHGGRDKLVIATKVGSEMAPDKKGLSKDYIIKAAEDSLRRLKTDYIDLYQSHYDDPETPIEETLEAYQQLLQAGKIRMIGASNMSPDRLMESLEISKKNGFPVYQTLQPEYNLYDREAYETDFGPIVAEEELSVISYYSLASGFLTGKYRSESDLNKSQRGGGVKKYMNKRGFRILDALDEIANEYSTTQAAVSLAWLMSRPNIAAPIASATSLRQVDEFFNAVQLTLRPVDLEKLNEASAY